VPIGWIIHLYQTDAAGIRDDAWVDIAGPDDERVAPLSFMAT